MFEKLQGKFELNDKNFQDSLGMNILRRQQIEKKKKKAENETRTRLEGLKGEHNQKLWSA